MPAASQNRNNVKLNMMGRLWWGREYRSGDILGEGGRPDTQQQGTNHGIIIRAKFRPRLQERGEEIYIVPPRKDGDSCVAGKVMPYLRLNSFRLGQRCANPLGSTE